MKDVNKHILALINFVALVPLVYFVPEFVQQFLPDIKLLLVMVSVALIVPVISYLVMPFSIKALQSTRFGNNTFKQ